MDSRCDTRADARLDFVVAVINAIGEISKQEAVDAIVREWQKLAAVQPPVNEQMVKALTAYAEWCGGVHDDGCPEDDTCDCSGAWINQGVTDAVNYLRGAVQPPVSQLKSESRSPDGDGPSMKSRASGVCVARPADEAGTVLTDAASGETLRAGSEPADSHQVQPPVSSTTQTEEAIREKLIDALAVVIQSWDRCRICGAENSDEHDSEPHGFEPPEIVPLFLEEIRGVGLDIALLASSAPPTNEDANSWIVVIGSGVWAKCYGRFVSHDAVMAWVRANQFEVENAHAFPVNLPIAAPPTPDAKKETT